MGPVVILGDERKPNVVRAVEESRPRLEREFGVVAIDLKHTMDLATTPAKWAVVFGGDGAILSASRRMRDRPIPTLAVNFGRFGFLTEITYDQLPLALDRIRSGDCQVRERMRLLARVGSWAHHALNDVVVSGGIVGRLFHVSLSISGREAIRYSGDGVVVATPTGSTAYNLAAGGPILDPDLRAIVITPLCAHALAQRPLVIPAQETIEATPFESDPPGLVAVDGQVRRELILGERLEVVAAREPFLLIRVGFRPYYQRLRDMLGWGARSGSPQ